MGIVTIDTLKAFGFKFKEDKKESIAVIISNHEKDYYDAALSPQLADDFVTDPAAARFQSLREGWIDEDNCRQKSIDYGVNYWCAWWIIKELSYSIIDGYVGTPTSKNKEHLNASAVFGNETYNNASRTAYNVTLKIMEDIDDFPEFTEARDLSSFSFYN